MATVILRLSSNGTSQEHLLVNVPLIRASQEARGVETWHGFAWYVMLCVVKHSIGLNETDMQAIKGRVMHVDADGERKNPTGKCPSSYDWPDFVVLTIEGLDLSEDDESSIRWRNSLQIK